MILTFSLAFALPLSLAFHLALMAGSRYESCGAISVVCRWRCAGGTSLVSNSMRRFVPFALLLGDKTRRAIVFGYGCEEVNDK